MREGRQQVSRVVTKGDLADVIGTEFPEDVLQIEDGRGGGHHGDEPAGELSVDYHRLMLQF